MNHRLLSPRDVTPRRGTLLAKQQNQTPRELRIVDVAPERPFEVHMSGRRSHQRFTVATPWDGAMRVLRDVVVNRLNHDELLAVSQTPAVIGEEMSLALVGDGSTLEFRVKVLESRPVIVDGSVRHRIRLGLLPPTAAECDLASSRAIDAASAAAEAI